MTHGRLLLCILLIALSLRIAFILTRGNRFYSPDSHQYSAIADNIISGKGFSISEGCKDRRPLFISYTWQWKGIIFLILPVLYFSLLHTIYVGSIRSRISVESYLIILATVFCLTKVKPLRTEQI